MTRGLLFILFCTVAFITSAQFSDDFSDGDFTASPEWTGDVADFEVLDGELHLNAPAASDESHLVTLSPAIEEAIWEFDLRMTVNPSNSNRAKIYLVSDSPDLEGDLNGYFVLVGNTNNKVSLYRQTGGSDSEVIQGANDVVNADEFAIRVRVTRDEAANWTLQHDMGLTGTFVTVGSEIDDTHPSSSYFGLLCDYSTNNSTAFYLDNVSVTGSAFVDEEAPEVVDVEVVDSTTLLVTYSEAVEAASAENVANYEWEEGMIPASATLSASQSEVTLVFSTGFPINTYADLTVSGVMDLAGNQMVDTTIGFIYDVELPEVLSVSVLDANSLNVLFSKPMDTNSAEDVTNYDWVGTGAPTTAELSSSLLTVTLGFSDDFPVNEIQTLGVQDVMDAEGVVIEPDFYAFVLAVVSEVEAGDVVINEILADPDGIGVLKDAEYIELFNTSDQIFSTEGWEILDGSTPLELPQVILTPGAYLLITNVNKVVSLEEFGEVVGLVGFGVTNTGEYLALIDSEEGVIDEVDYDPDQYDGAESRGVSLERRKPVIECDYSGNYGASQASIGGTPGEVNSIFDGSPDVSAPRVSEVLLRSDDELQLVFNEPLDELSVITGEYAARDENGGVVAVEIIDAIDEQNIGLTFFSQLEQGVLYSISLSGITDCPENPIDPGEVYYFALPDSAHKEDVVLNEILFDPRGDGVDYVELYNNSDRYISLEGWLLGKRDQEGLDEEPDPDDFVEIIDRYRLLRPGHYVLLSTSNVKVLNDYPRGERKNFLMMDGFPTMPNDEGTVILRTDGEQPMDEFYYSDDYHFALLDIVDGVSLERIDFDRPTNDPTNWHSAAESVGFGTPGYENSQSLRPEIPATSFQVLPEIFSPDNDGIDDVAVISYSLEKEGHVANTDIFDRNGRLVRRLNRNELLGREGSFTWDGISDDRSKAPIGIYIIYIEVYDLFGNVSSVKKTVVLGGRLN